MNQDTNEAESVGEQPRQGQGFEIKATGTCEACGEWTRTYFDGVRTNSNTGEHGYLCHECWGGAYGADDFRVHWPGESITDPQEEDVWAG